MSVALQKHVKTSSIARIRDALAGDATDEGSFPIPLPFPPSLPPSRKVARSDIPDVILSKGVLKGYACNYPNTLLRTTRHLHNFMAFLARVFSLIT